MQGFFFQLEKLGARDVLDLLVLPNASQLASGRKIPHPNVEVTSSWQSCTMTFWALGKTLWCKSNLHRVLPKKQDILHGVSDVMMPLLCDTFTFHVRCALPPPRESPSHTGASM